MTLTKYTPLLHKIAKKFPYKYRQDLIQEGYIALNRASELYNPDRNTSFESYAFLEVFGRMNRYINKEHQYSSLDNFIDDEDGNTTTYADLLESEENLEEDIQNRDLYKKNLDNSTVVERFIKQRYYEEEMTPQEIVNMYQEFTHIRDVRKIRRIIKKY